MKKLFLSCLIMLMLFSAGCTTYFSNLTAGQHNLKPDEYAIFEKEGNRFTAQIVQIEGGKSSSSSRIAQITVTIQVKNTGTKAISLMAYPRLSDALGNQYPGQSIFLGMLNPGGQATGKSSISIPTDEAYNNLKNTAALSLRFQDTKLIPYEATWDIDLSTL
jgi:hypothetical protein